MLQQYQFGWTMLLKTNLCCLPRLVCWSDSWACTRWRGRRWRRSFLVRNSPKCAEDSDPSCSRPPRRSEILWATNSRGSFIYDVTVIWRTLFILLVKLIGIDRFHDSSKTVLSLWPEGWISVLKNGTGYLPPHSYIPIYYCPILVFCCINLWPIQNLKQTE